MNRFHPVVSLFVIGSCAWGVVSPAAATDESVAFEITVSNAQGAAVLSVPYSSCDWSPDRESHGWSEPFPLALEDVSGALVATLSGASFEVRYAPVAEVNVSFALIAGDSLTTVVVTAPSLVFETIPAIDANGRTAISLTISDEDSSGFAEFKALGTPGNGAFKAKYNGRGPSAPTFASLIYSGSVQSPIPNTPAGTLNVSDRFPDIGFHPIGSDVSAISVYLGLTVTAHDVLGVTGSMTLSQAVPPPPCPGDVDGDGSVNLVDLGMLMSMFDACDADAGFDPAGDFDDDGCITLTDLAITLSEFDSSCN